MFQKDSGPYASITGFFKYFPLWSLQELQIAQPFINPSIPSDAIELRYYQVGGVPRHIFEDERSFDRTKETQRRAMSVLTKDQATKIARGEFDAVESMTSQQPKSAIVGFQQAQSDDMSFDEETLEVVEISAFVAETIYTKYMKDL